MARIRTIKPDALQHRKVGKLSDRAFRIWVGMLTQADDEGRLPCDPRQIAAWCFGYHRTVTLQQIENAIQEIQSLHLVYLYTVDGTRYACFPSWKDHQKIDKARKSLYPEPPQPIPQPFDECSTNVPLSFALEGKGRDKKGSGMEGSVRETIYREIVEDLNDLLKEAKKEKRRDGLPSGNYDPNSKTIQSFIDKLISQGKKPEDFWNVHRNKLAEWKDDEKMRKFLRPSTLYRESHFDEYLGQGPRRTYTLEETEDAEKKEP